MKNFYFILFLILFTTNKIQAQNDSIYFWKSGNLISKQSIQPSKLDSITFKRPVPITKPILTTVNPSSISFNSAVSGGNISSTGGANVTARGICWSSTNSNPTIALSTKTINGSGSGVFTSNITNLSPNTVYYIRAYATNRVGTSYGNQITFTTPYTYPPGTVTCGSVGNTAIVNVINGTTGKIWMDRNLGATRAAEEPTDVNSYGDLYQWGRRADGHQCRNSNTTTTLSSTDVPSHGLFITPTGTTKNWRSPQNKNLWQGVNGINNPCPGGYRLPTKAEFNEERLSWGNYANNHSYIGAFNSPLKLPLTERRSDRGEYTTPTPNNLTNSRYWTSTAGNNSAQALYIGTGSSTFTLMSNASGISVRCIKD